MTQEEKILGEYASGDWSEDTMVKFTLVIHEPLVFIVCVTPFTCPLFSVKARGVPGLVSGNKGIVKPVSDNPIVSLLFGRALQEAGIPEGVVNVNTGPGKEMEETLVNHEYCMEGGEDHRGGSASISDVPPHGVGFFPFGNNKDLGTGREGAGNSIDETTRIKTIQFNLAPAGFGKARQAPKI